jgi:protein O-GlcNAc transferase
MKKFLHVGCGVKNKCDTTEEFFQWQELRFDIDPKVNPDILGTMTDMTMIEDEYTDAIFSSHNIEHLYAHEVPIALSEFYRVLKKDGYVVLTCPDLQAVCSLVVADGLTDVAYVSLAGPISPIDILYGFRPALKIGNFYMAHRTGFTQKTLIQAFESNRFISTISIKRAAPYYDIWFLASKENLDHEKMLKLAKLHFPS